MPGLELKGFDFYVHVAGASHVGRKRSNNEDAWRADLELGLFAVADGMGGHSGGEVASAVTLSTLFDALRVPEAKRAFDDYVASPTLELRRHVFAMLHWAIEQAHNAVREQARRDRTLKGMGCTLDVALLLSSSGFVAHVGDSRTYLARPEATIQLTQDHTMQAALLAGGLGTKSSPPKAKNVLAGAIGVSDKLKIDDVFSDVEEDDRVVLCSDGVHSLVDEQQIAKLSRAGSADDAVHALIGAALDRGGDDNATAVVAVIGERRNKRSAYDGGLRARDATLAATCALLRDLPTKQQSRVLSAAIEVSFEAARKLPRFSAEDRVSYVVLDGEVATPEGWTVGPGALLYPESLAGAGRGTALCQAVLPVRALRIRHDDFSEVCSNDPVLAATLYQRIARTLAQRF